MKKNILLLCFIFCLPMVVFAQKKTIEDYYKLLKPKLELGMMEGQSLKIIEKDINNGFMKIAEEPSSMGSPVYEMALWRDSKNNPLIGIFQYGCGGMGCGGLIDDLKFYNAEMQDITSRVVDLNQIKKYFEEKIGDNLSRGGCEVRIPKVGTTIQIKPQASFFPQINKLPSIELIYNAATNSFSMVKK